MLLEMGVAIDFLGGNCPVQADGTVDGKPFYFRSRGASWSMSIGGADVVGEPEWYHEQPYGEWPAAGWITTDEAEAFIASAVCAFREGVPSMVV